MIRRVVAMLALTALTGCGALGAGVPVAGGTPSLVDGWKAVAVTPQGVRATHPSLIARRAGGYMLAYASEKLGDRHVYLTQSADGQRWSPPVVVARGPLTEEAPALYEDPQGQLHLIFSSNRNQAFALFETTSADGATWTDAQALPADDDQCYRPAVTLLPAGGVALAYETLGHGIRLRTRAVSGAWSAPSDVQDEGGDVAIAAAPDGTLTLAFASYGHLCSKVRSVSGSWSAAVTLDDEAGTPALAGEATGTWLLYAAKEGGGSKICEQMLASGSVATSSRLTTGTTTDDAPAACLAPDGSHLAAWSSAGAPGGGTIYFGRRL